MFCVDYAQLHKTLRIAVPEALNCSFDDFDGPVIRFKTRLLLKDVLPAIEMAGAPQSSNLSSELSGSAGVRGAES